MCTQRRSGQFCCRWCGNLNSWVRKSSRANLKYLGIFSPYDGVGGGVDDGDGTLLHLAKLWLWPVYGLVWSCFNSDNIFVCKRDFYVYILSR